ncbi:MAG: hypothetical protein IJ493_12370 [Clostridia bacterium]|nr:hypothetical protein [Clostridia bacterium]
MKKNEQLLDAVGGIDDRHVNEADQTRGKRALRKAAIRWGAGICAAAVVVVGVGVALGRTPSYAIVEVEYPYMAPYPNMEGSSEEVNASYEAWADSRDELSVRLDDEQKEILVNFTKKMLPVLLAGNDGENLVTSPLNVYMALSMLAELTGGESRAQIEALLGVSGEELRTLANALWRNQYANDGARTCIPANSIWLREGVKWNQEPLDVLASSYYASSYQGDFGSDGYTKAMKSWLNEQTGGLLSDYVEDIQPDANTILTLLSTVYYKTKWYSEFDPDETTDGVFHGASGDVDAEFMHYETDEVYYWGDTFAAVRHTIDEGGYMWFVLPDEGMDFDELLADEGLLDMLSGASYKNYKRLIVNKSIPKFDVSSSLDLSEIMTGLGITDVFDRFAADFTPLVAGDQNAYLSGATHAERVAIDEEGITAASYVEMTMYGAAPPPDERVEIVFDRPFLFVITERNSIPLFAGVVNNP